MSPVPRADEAIPAGILCQRHTYLMAGQVSLKTDSTPLRVPDNQR